MHWTLRRTLRDLLRDTERGDVLRSEPAALDDRRTALEIRKLLLHNAPDAEVETFFERYLKGQ